MLLSFYHILFWQPCFGSYFMNAAWIFSKVDFLALACDPYMGLWDIPSQAAKAQHGSFNGSFAVAPVDIIVKDFCGPVPPVYHGFDLR